MNRLLNRTLIYYSLFAIVILLLSAPFIYLTMEKLYREDVDEAILLRRDEFNKNQQPTLEVSDIPVWNRYNRDIRILPDTVVSFPKDQIVQQFFYDTLAPEWEPYRVLYKDVHIAGEPKVLMIRLNLVESQDLIMTIVWIYIGILAGLLTVIFFVTKFVSSRLWKGFYDTLRKIEQFNIEQQVQPRFLRSNVKEFGQLNQSIQKLIAHNLHSYQVQKAFTQNASHELQTPLAVLQSRLDLLLQDPNIEKHNVRILHSLYESVSRLSRINKNLLLLARIENNQFPDTTSFSLKGIISEVLPYFTEQAQYKNLKIAVQFHADIALKANKTLTEILINNLLLNAVRHNIEKGEIVINIKDDVLTIANTGPLQELNSEIIFGRFIKLTTDKRSSGLGLAIASEICERYEWQFSYQFTQSLHCFKLTF